MNPFRQPIDRRSMLASAARYVTLGGLGFLAWKLISRPGGDACRYTTTCTDCQLLAHCRLPLARQRRAQQTRNTL